MKDGYDHRDALFGIPPFGGSIQGKVYYTSDTMCGAQIDALKGYPVEKDKNGKLVQWQSPFILMIDRGACSFVQKVRNAQRAGAAAVLIADTTCLCGSRNCTMPAKQLVCEKLEPVMADDGSGADISIPAFLTFKQDADRIKEVIIKNQVVRAEMSFSVPAPDSRVEYELWTTPTDRVAFPFLSSFGSAADALAKDASFTPRMYIIDGQSMGCRSIEYNDAGLCSGICTNGGRYCATDPDNELDKGVSGAEVVAESLRRICIWNTYGKDGVGGPWWMYIEKFLESCTNRDDPTLFSDPECVDLAMTFARVDSAVIEKCFVASGGLEGDKPNFLLDASIADVNTRGVFLLPSLYVNKAPVRGMMSYGAVFKALCSGYARGYEPDICESCANCHDEQKCVLDGKCTTGYDEYQMNPGVSAVTFVASMSGISLLFCVVGYILYTRQQRRMRDEVRGILAEYMPVGS